jgi:hypothetical protein
MLGSRGGSLHNMCSTSAYQKLRVKCFFRSHWRVPISRQFHPESQKWPRESIKTRPPHAFGPSLSTVSRRMPPVTAYQTLPWRFYPRWALTDPGSCHCLAKNQEWARLEGRQQIGSIIFRSRSFYMRVCRPAIRGGDWKLLRHKGWGFKIGCKGLFRKSGVRWVHIMGSDAPRG